MSFFTQLKALIRRNILLKKRNRRQLFQEIFYPIYFVAILIAISLAVPRLHYDAYSRPPRFVNASTLRGQSILVAPAHPPFDSIFDRMEKIIGTHLSRFPTEDALVAEYRVNNTADRLGLVFNDMTSGQTTYDYIIRTPYDSTPGYYSNGVRKGEQDDCFGINHTCNGDLYLTSNFINLQFVVDTAIIQGVNSSYVGSEYGYQLLPVGKMESTGAFLRTFASIYIIIAFSPFINYLVLNLVVEKEKKIKIVMQMMGLRTTALW